MIYPSTIKVNIEGGWRGGDRYPVATAIDRLLDFPRERERGGEEKKRWWGWPKKKSGGSNQR